MLRLFHKYLSLVISIQLLLWTVSGVFFAFNKIELIRGEQYLVEVKSSELNLDNVEVAFAAKNISFLQRLDEWIIKVEDESVSHYTDLEGKKLKELNAEEAKVVVTRSTNLTPLEVIRIERAGPGAEFRGRNLPIYKVSTLTDDDVNVYVDAFVVKSLPLGLIPGGHGIFCGVPTLLIILKETTLIIFGLKFFRS